MFLNEDGSYEQNNRDTDFAKLSLQIVLVVMMALLPVIMAVAGTPFMMVAM